MAAELTCLAHICSFAQQEFDDIFALFEADCYHQRGPTSTILERGQSRDCGGKADMLDHLQSLGQVELPEHLDQNPFFEPAVLPRQGVLPQQPSAGAGGRHRLSEWPVLNLPVIYSLASPFTERSPGVSPTFRRLSTTFAGGSLAISHTEWCWGSYFVHS